MSLEIFKEAWERATTCQQCKGKLSPAELKAGDRICGQCVKKNKGKIWGKDSDDDEDLDEHSVVVSFSDYLQETSAMTDTGKPIVQEVTPPGMESWVKANKSKFIKQYGQDKGLNILYSTAWDMHNKKKSEEASRMD
jgi:hypothetical protein